MRFTLAIAGVLFAGTLAAGGEEVPGLTELWRRELARGFPDQYGSVEIVGNAVYATNTGGEVHRLALRTGESVWKVTLPARIQSGLAATPEALFVATREGVFRLKPEDGNTVWSTDIGGPVSAVPAVDGGEVLAGTNTVGRIALLRAGDGTVLWRRQISLNVYRCGLAGPYALVAVGGDEARGLHVLDRKTGETMWRYGAGGSGFAIGPGVVYSGDAALRLRDGKVVWTTLRAARTWAAGESILVGTFGRDRIAAFDPRTGRKLWGRVVTEAGKRTMFALRSGAILVGDRVVAAVEGGDVLVLDAATGRVVSVTRFELGDPSDLGHFHGPPAIAGGVLVVATGGCKNLGLAWPDVEARWPGEHGGRARWGWMPSSRTAGLPSAEPPEPMGTPKEARALEIARAVEEPNERADALAIVARRYGETEAGRTAFELLLEIYDERLSDLSVRNMPAGEWEVSFPDLEQEVREYVAAKDLRVRAPGFAILDPPEVAEALGSNFAGRRAWACERMSEISTDAARRVLVYTAARDETDLVRAAAVAALGGHGGPKEVRDALNRALQDESDHVRRAACAVVPRILTAHEAPRVLRYMVANDPDDLVREFAREKLAELE
jgi:outer membrane protein assembly factor BamB